MHRASPCPISMVVSGPVRTKMAQFGPRCVRCWVLLVTYGPEEGRVVAGNGATFFRIGEFVVGGAAGVGFSLRMRTRRK